MNQSVTNFWNEILQIPEARWIVAGTLLTFAILIAVYVSIFFRKLAFGGGGVEATDVLSDFRKMRDDGQLEDEEFSRLKTVIPGEKRTNARKPAGEVEPEEEKKNFMTLAEAERAKQQNSARDGADEDNQADSID